MAAAFHDVCIRGAGIVGRTLALLLAKERLQIALVMPEETPGQSALQDVRAYAISPAARAVLSAVRGWPMPAPANAASAVTPVRAMRVQGDRRGALEFSAEDLGAEALNWIVEVPALERQLAEAVRYQSGIDCVTEPVAAPLTVVCEGGESATRDALGVSFERIRYPQDAIATRLDCEHPHAQLARQWFGEDGDILAFLPLGGEAGRQVAVVWSVPTAWAPELAALDDGAFAARLHVASAGALGAVSLAGPRVVWPLQLGLASTAVGTAAGAGADSAFALAGDAAHTLHPLAGQGLNVGLGDAAELARVLGTRESWRGVGDLRMLRRYERARRADWQRMRLATDGLQQLFARREPGAALLRNWGLSLFDMSGPLKRRLARAAMGTV